MPPSTPLKPTREHAHCLPHFILFVASRKFHILESRPFPSSSAGVTILAGEEPDRKEQDKQTSRAKSRWEQCKLPRPFQKTGEL